MADENPLYPESNSFNDRWGGLPVEAPRFNYTPQSSLIESEPRKIEPYKLTPVEGDPFERAAERLRAPYKHVNDIPEGNIPYRSNLPLIGEKFGHIIQSGATSPLAAFRGEFLVSDLETGMPTPEAIQRSQDVAALGGPGGLVGGAETGAIVGSGPIRSHGPSIEVRTVGGAAKQEFPIEKTFGVNNEPIYTVKDGNKFIAEARLSHTGEHIVDLGVAPEYRRQGIASDLYDHIENDLGRKLKPSPVYQTEAGKAFWDNRLKSDTSEPGIAVAAIRHSGYPAPEIIDRVYPAVRNLETGKVSTANRGNEHADILHKLWVKEGGDPRVDTMNLYRQMLPKHETGFYDPKTKQFHSKSEEEWRNLDTPDLNARQAMRSGMVFSDTQKPGMAVAALRSKDKLFGNQLDHTNAATFTDKNGYTATVIPKKKGEVLGTENTRKGLLYITDPSGNSVRNGFWMDFPEEYNNPKAHKEYYSKSQNERAATEAKIQATEYKSLKEQFEERSKDKSFGLLSDTQKPGMALAAAQPFYSAVENAVGNIKSNKMPADQWLGTLNNAKGVKPEEMDWIGLKEHLAGKGKEPVTKQEIQDFVNANKVELKEVDKGHRNIGDYTHETSEEWQRAIERAERNRNFDEAHRLTLAQEEQAGLGEKGTPKFSQYQLPGGENYQEKLLMLPEKQIVEKARYNELRNESLKRDLSPAEREEFSNIADKFSSANRENYQSTHWDEPNVLAHVRMNDRTIEGKKSLHLEEIQSDWHQTGREKGYKGTDKNLSPVDQGAIDAFGVPNAPFKKTWHELVLKRMLREAAEKGYDRLSWTPGEAQRTNPKNLGQTGEKADKTDKGLRKWYNEIIPQALEKIGKEHGVKVKTADVSVDSTPRSLAYFLEWGEKNHPRYKRSELGKMWANGANDPVVQQFMKETKPQPIRYIDIPQSLKDQALGKGFPLFSGGHMFTPVAGNPHSNGDNK